MASSSEVAALAKQLAQLQQQMKTKKPKTPARRESSTYVDGQFADPMEKLPGKVAKVPREHWNTDVSYHSVLGQNQKVLVKSFKSGTPRLYRIKSNKALWCFCLDSGSVLLGIAGDLAKKNADPSANVAKSLLYTLVARGMRSEGRSFHQLKARRVGNKLLLTTVITNEVTDPQLVTLFTDRFPRNLVTIREDSLRDNSYFDDRNEEFEIPSDHIIAGTELLYDARLGDYVPRVVRPIVAAPLNNAAVEQGAGVDQAEVP